MELWGGSGDAPSDRPVVLASLPRPAHGHAALFIPSQRLLQLEMLELIYVPCFPFCFLCMSTLF